MMLRAVSFLFLAMLASVALATPTVDQVYAAAHAGRYGEADAMIREVLKEKPDSAKAHYVHAQILAAMRDNAGARAELDQAERLAPGLPFAKSSAVRDLRAHISGAPAARSASGGISWGPILVGALLVFAIIFFIRRLMALRSAPQLIPAASPYSAGPMATPMQTGPTPGMGSSLASGLATGLGVGAGIVAGEALAHSLFDHGRTNDTPNIQPSDDLGGNDFGLNDSQSWDGGGGDIGGGMGGDW